MTDHAAAAERILNEPGYGYAEGNDPHGAAQVHATLALVEVTEHLAVAQETANLIAFAAYVDNAKNPGDMGRMALSAVRKVLRVMEL